MGMTNMAIGGGASSGSSSSSSDSTNHSYAWDSGIVEDYMNTDFNDDFYYQGHNALTPNAGQKSLFNYFTDPARYQSGKNIVNKGMGIASQGMGILQNLTAMTPDQVMGWIEGTAAGLYDKGSNFQAQQDAVIEDNVMATMGSSLAQNATNMNAGGATAGSSALNNSAMGILSGGAQSMESQEAQLDNKMMGTAVGMAGNAASMYGRTQGKAASALLGIGGNIIGAGTSAEKAAINNANKMFNAQFIGTGINNAMSRNDNMIINNMDIAEQEYWLKTMLQTAGIDTTSQTHTSGSSSSSSGHMGFSI